MNAAMKVVLGSLIAAVLAIVAVLVFFAATARAHEAPTGWTYPWSCCSNQDCKRVDNATVHETPGGYVVDGSTDDVPIGYHDKRLKDSPDSDFHWCAHQSGPDVGNTICLFVPGKGS